MPEDKSYSTRVSAGNLIHTQDAIVKRVVDDYLNKHPAGSMIPKPLKMTEELIDAINDELRAENSLREKDEKYRLIKRITPPLIAHLIYHCYPVVIISYAETTDREKGDLALYMNSGPKYGTYSTDLSDIKLLAKEFFFQASSRDLDEVIAHLQTLAPVVTVCHKRNLIAVNNGIFDYDTKTLMPFDPQYVFTSKCRVNYNPHATNVIIHNDNDGTDWDVENWMLDLSDDDEIVNLLWCVLGAIIRPNVRWDKIIWMYSDSGNNGKGTLCALMRELCGVGNYASIQVSEFAKDFMLESLLTVSANIVDENDVGSYLDRCASFKAVATQDVVNVNRKHKTTLPMVFRGLNVFCMNDLPKIKDKTDSLYRRMLIIPMMKSFTGKERKYIKDDYIKRTDVLEYVLYRVLNMNYYELPVPDACKDALDAYKEYVDPVRAFLIEMIPLFVWDLVPYQFLYELFIEWYRRTSGGDRNTRSRVSFIKDVQKLIDQLFPDWGYTDKISMRSGSRMDQPEPLINEYNLENWMNPIYKDQKGDPIKRCVPLLVEKYKGIYRK